MSLYHEAAQILSKASQEGGSIKSVVFGKKDWKSNAKTLFALATEAAKWSEILTEVIEASGILALERQVSARLWYARGTSAKLTMIQLSPELSLLLTHDLLLSKRGIALTSQHGLHAAISRHRARLTAELSKIRLKRGCATVDALRVQLESDDPLDGRNSGLAHPRWLRVNSLRTSLEEQLSSTFVDYQRAASLADVVSQQASRMSYWPDDHIPNLIAVPLKSDITTTKAYKDGKIILQDKASCFPAYLLDPSSLDGDIIDACAAPGNKTTHLAALVRPSIASRSDRKIFACEKDGPRAEILSNMVKLAGAADIVRVKAKQDFLRLNPQSDEFSNVTAILLDPSCSGSGIIGRDEVTVKVRLPRIVDHTASQSRGKKRKRKQEQETARPDPGKDSVSLAHVAESENEPLVMPEAKLATRLAALSSFQLRILEHAMSFPAAKRISYSTCSVHKEENEFVVLKALQSQVALSRKWRILRRDEQIEGLRKWHIRGDAKAVAEGLQDHSDAEQLLDASVITEACIRCEKAGADGTMGFFVAGFLRDANQPVRNVAMEHGSPNGLNNGADIEEEWSGFSDS